MQQQELEKLLNNGSILFMKDDIIKEVKPPSYGQVIIKLQDNKVVSIEELKRTKI